MDNSQTPQDYKNYFSNKFISLFKNLVDTILTSFDNNSEQKKNILRKVLQKRIKK